MSYKEKSAWVMFVALLLGALFYGNWIYGNWGNESAVSSESSPLIGIVVVYVLIVVLISILGHIIAAIGSTDDAEVEEDERDKLIVIRANSMSSHVLGLGAVSGILMYLLGGDGDFLFHLILGSLTLSAVAEYALRIYFYRWGV